MGGTVLPSIIAIGIALVDIYPQQMKMYPGGNEYNISCFAKELGAQSSFMGVFAPDKAGLLLENILVKRGINVSHCRHAHGFSNYALVELRNGNRVFTDWSRNGVTDMNPISFTPEDLDFIRGHDVACVSYASRLNYKDFHQLYEAGIDLCYDFSDSFSLEVIEQICPLIRFGFFSCDHLDQTQIILLMERAVNLGCKVAVATRGKLGSMAWDGNELFSQPAIKVPVVDTMGAGDSFIAAFLNKWYSVDNSFISLPIAMRAAAEFASEIIQRKGALGVGFNIDGLHLEDIINIKEEKK
jgi:fructoselysine 6-kinase